MQYGVWTQRYEVINVLKRTIFGFVAIFDDYPNIQVLVAQVLLLYYYYF